MKYRSVYRDLGMRQAHRLDAPGHFVRLVGVAQRAHPHTSDGPAMAPHRQHLHPAQPGGTQPFGQTFGIGGIGKSTHLQEDRRL